eukprot:scaffold65412_cov83-Cyclotella_meneghiniana.AAC.2
MESLVLKAGEDVPDSIIPYCASVSLSTKPQTDVFVTGGINGIAVVKSVEAQLKQADHAVGSPITAIIAIDNSPLIVAGTYDGYICCIHVGRTVDADNQHTLSTTLLRKEKVSCRPVTTVCYQATTKKLAIVTTDSEDKSQVTIVCMEPNNIKIIGNFAPTSVDTLTWSKQDHKLLVSHNGSLSCFDIIQMTFENDANSECLWTRDTGLFHLRQMIPNNDGTMIYAIDGRRRGFYTIALLNAADSNDQLSSMHYKGNKESLLSASSCLLLDNAGDQLIIGTVSGETIILQLSNKDIWDIICTHSSAVTSICKTSNGFMTSSMDGTVTEHRKNDGHEQRTPATSSAQWDYLVELQRQHGNENTDSSINNDQNLLLYRRNESCVRPDKGSAEVIEVNVDQIIEIKKNGLSNEQKDKVLLYSQSLNDIRDIKSQLCSDYNNGATLSDHIYVLTELGEAGLYESKENDEYIVIDSREFSSKKDVIVDLKNEIIKLEDIARNLSSNTKLLEWTQRLLQLQVHDALEESKDWQQLRVNNHLRQIVNGTAVSEDTALTNSLDQMSIVENIHKSQLDTYQQASLRLMEQLKSIEEENQLLKRQTEEANEKISQRKKEYSSVSEVKSKEANQKDKMRQILKSRKLADEVRSQENHITELNSQLTKLRARTYPNFQSSTNNNMRV